MISIINKKSQNVDPFKPGYLTFLFSELRKGNRPTKLENHHLTLIATALGTLSKGNDLYNILFEQSNQTLEMEKRTVETKDLAAFVLMDHLYTRGYFAKSAASKATSDTTNCQGVPLALEGAKRLYNKKYSSWIPESTERENLWKLDIFLPADLCSFHLDDEGNIAPNKFYGLLNLYVAQKDFSPEVVVQLRECVPGWEVKHHPKMVTKAIWNQKELVIDDSYSDIYNKCSPKLRAMLLRGWVWQESCRNPDMICDPLNWDEYPKSIKFEGLKPTSGLDPYMEFLK